MSDIEPEGPAGSPIPAERLEALVDLALRGGDPADASPNERSFVGMVRLVRECVAADAAEWPSGVPSRSLDRAKSLASMLPQPGPSGLRSWWDRAVAAVASCLHDDLTMLAGVGLRRGGAVRQASFEAETRGVRVAIDLEIERLTSPERGRVRGQVSAEGGNTGAATATFVRDGAAETSAVVDRDGFFEFEIPAGRGDLAIHLGEAGAVVLPDLEIP